MNTFLNQALTEVKSEDFQAEGQLALEFILRVFKVLFLTLVGLSLSTYILGVQGYRYLHSSHLPPQVVVRVNDIEEYFTRYLKIVKEVIGSNYNKLVVFYVVPLFSFIKGLTSGFENK